jgi:hypothetical protein
MGPPFSDRKLTDSGVLFCETLRYNVNGFPEDIQKQINSIS